MSSIIKVDQIQLSDGSTPTAGDLGISVTEGITDIDSWAVGDVYFNNASMNPLDAATHVVTHKGTGVTFTNGIITLPKTGVWQIYGNWSWYTPSNTSYSMENASVALYISRDSGSTYTQWATAETAIDFPANDWWRAEAQFTTVVTINNTTTDVLKLWAYNYNSANLYLGTGGNTNGGNVHFMRLGDS